MRSAGWVRVGAGCYILFLKIMALPAGMGLSAAAAAAGYSYMSPNPTPEPVDSALVTHITEAEDPEEMLLGGLAALSEPEAPTQAPGNGMLGGSAEGRGGPRRYDGDNGGIGMDPARVQLRQQQQQQQPQPQQSQQEQQQQQQQCPIMPPVIPPRYSSPQFYVYQCVHVIGGMFSYAHSSGLCVSAASSFRASFVTAVIASCCPDLSVLELRTYSTAVVCTITHFFSSYSTRI